MQTPPTASRRKTHAFLRSVAMLVIVAFTMLILAPTAVAARQYYNEYQQAAAHAPSDEARLSLAVSAIEELLSEMAQKLEQQQAIGAERNQLRQLRAEVATLDTAVRANFTRIGNDLQAKGLPAIIQQRHADTVATYAQELATLLANLQAIESATDNTIRKTRVGKAKGHLKEKKHKRSQQPFDPNDLPNKVLRPDPNNKPKDKPEAFADAGLHNNPFTQIAALGDFTYDQLAGASDPAYLAYLAETDEIKLTRAIQDKAAELDHDPVKIHQWVRNNIEWLPTWGAIQDAELTLSAKRGNAFDIASLSISLLRASGIPARYAHGVVTIPAAQFNNWTGNFSNLNAAVDFASTGGIPLTTIISGGQISNIRLEHIWVEAAIDYHPSRGARNRAADSWVAMDPSYKQYAYLQGLDAIAISGIDPEALAQSFLDSGTVNEAEGWVTGFDPHILQTAQEQAQQKLETYIQENMTDPTVGDVIGGRKTIVKEYPVLPSGLPYKTDFTGARYGKLPGPLQQTVSYAFGTDSIGYPINPITFPWAKLNNQKVTLSFKPATQADEDALAALLPEGEITDISQLPSSIPSYLINVLPELKVNGQTIKTGTAMKLGEEVNLVTQVSFPHYALPARAYSVIAGSYLSVNVIAGSVSPQRLTELQTRMEQTKTILETQDPEQIGNLTREDLLGDMFQAGSLGYYAQYLALAHISGLPQGGHYNLAAGIGTVGYEPYVSYFFGFPRAIESGGVSFDIPIVNIFGISDGDVEKKKQFIQQIGILSSTLEHAVPEQMFASQDPNDPAPDAISAVKALQKASAAGQRIYQITQANMATTLPNIHHDTATITEIRNALLVGTEVITHTNAVSVPGWSGAGYIILDPDTGSGAYKIGDGANGGWFSLEQLSIIIESILDIVIDSAQATENVASAQKEGSYAECFITGLAIYSVVFAFLIPVFIAGVLSRNPLGFLVAFFALAFMLYHLSVFHTTCREHFPE